MSDEVTLRRSLDEVHIDISTRLLPILQLCKFASNAAQQLQEFRNHGDISPEFKAGMERATEYMNTPLPEEAHELVSGALWEVERLVYQMQGRIELAMQLDAARGGVQG